MGEGLKAALKRGRDDKTAKTDAQKRADFVAGQTDQDLTGLDDMGIAALNQAMSALTFGASSAVGAAGSALYDKLSNNDAVPGTDFSDPANTLSFSELMRHYQNVAATRERENPLSALTGEVAGSVVGTVGLMKGIKALADAGVSSAAQLWTQLTNATA